MTNHDELTLKDAFKVQFGDENMHFQAPVKIDDPKPTGRQLLQAADAKPIRDHLIFQLLENGNIRECPHDDTVDLRKEGVEQFLIFKSDRTFTFEVDDHRFEWGSDYVTGLVLKKLAKVDPQTYNVWQEIHGAEDRLIDDSQKASLTGKGVERFFTCIKETNEG